MNLFKITTNAGDVYFVRADEWSEAYIKFNPSGYEGNPENHVFDYKIVLPASLRMYTTSWKKRIRSIRQSTLAFKVRSGGGKKAAEHHDWSAMAADIDRDAWLDGETNTDLLIHRFEDYLLDRASDSEEEEF